jgi:hypothetical protein
MSNALTRVKSRYWSVHFTNHKSISCRRDETHDPLETYFKEGKVTREEATLLVLKEAGAKAEADAAIPRIATRYFMVGLETNATSNCGSW